MHTVTAADLDRNAAPFADRCPIEILDDSSFDVVDVPAVATAADDNPPWMHVGADDDRPWLDEESAWHKAEAKKGDPIGLHLCCDGILSTLRRDLDRRGVTSLADYVRVAGIDFAGVESAAANRDRRSPLATALVDVASWHLLTSPSIAERVVAREMLLIAAECDEWETDDYGDYLDAECAYRAAQYTFAMES